MQRDFRFFSASLPLCAFALNKRAPPIVAQLGQNTQIETQKSILWDSATFPFPEQKRLFPEQGAGYP